MELRQRLRLPGDVVEGLVAKDDVDAGIRQVERRDVAASQIDQRAALRRLERRALETVLVHVDRDDFLGPEMLLQRTERLALSATRVEHDRSRRLTVRRQ